MLRQAIALGLSLVPVGAAPAQPDPRQIVAPIVAMEARAHAADRRPVCLDPASFAAFDSVRERLRQLSNTAVIGGDEARVEQDMRRSFSSGAYGWLHYIEKPDGRAIGSPLSAEEAAPLTAAAANLIRKNAPAAVQLFDPEALPKPFVKKGRDHCSTLLISAPEAEGDIAFVETGFGCGPLCGFGELYALRRNNGRWSIVAVAPLWVS